MVRGKYKSILKMFFVIILSCIMAVTMNNAAMAVVIDVSGHDGLIDWDSAKEHIEGVIIRIGYGNDYAYQDDKQAVQNMDECERLGIPYGVYKYPTHCGCLKDVTRFVVYGLIWRMRMNTRKIMEWMYIVKKTGHCLQTSV